MATLQNSSTFVSLKADGSPNAFGKVYTYAAGTLTLQATYTTQAGDVPNANPVILGADGCAQIWRDPALSYRFIEKTRLDVAIPDRDIDNITSSTGADEITFTASGTGAEEVTVEAHLNGLPLITDFGGIVADGTDQTAEIVAWLGSLSSTTSKLYVIPYNCRFERASVIDAMPTGIIFLDLSGLNDYNNTGDVSKRIGFMSGDEAANDTALTISSGHHPAIMFNNFGTAGSTSGNEMNMSLIYARNMFALGNNGYREVAAQILKRSSGNDWWEWNFNRIAPWLAIASDYERWSASGDGVDDKYYMHAPNIYKCTTAGTFGGTGPSHTSGSASNGTATLEWVCTNEENILALDEYGRLRTNGGTATDLVSFKQRADDPASSATVTLQAGGTTKNVILALTPTDGSAVATVQPQLKASVASGLEVRKSDDSAQLAQFTDAGGAKFNAFRLGSTVATDADTTPSVAGVGTLICTNTGATSITALDGGTDNQIVVVFATNGNTTLVHSSTLMLTGSANQTLTAYSSITFAKVPTAISDRWIEIARSIK